jgi:hypothetical protein
MQQFSGISTERFGLLKSMFKASLVASAVFAIAWFRVPPSTIVIRYFIFYGILIVILSIGFLARAALDAIRKPP